MRVINPFHVLYLFYTSNLISPTRLLNHLQANRAAMFANNPGGIYTAEIANADAVILILQNAIAGRRTNLGQQVGKTGIVVTDIVDFEDFVHAEEGHLKYILAGTPGAFLEFFPHGLTEFNNITREKAPTLMAAFAAAAENNVGIVGAPFVTSCNGFVTDFGTDRGIQRGKMSNVKTDSNTIFDAVIGAAGQLVANHGIIAQNNRLNMAAGLAYFNYILLYRTRSTAHTYFEGNTPANTHTNGALIALDNADEITFHNLSSSNLLLYGALTADAAPGATFTKEIPGNSTRSCTPDEINAIANHYLNVQNLNLTDPGPWKIDIHDA